MNIRNLLVRWLLHDGERIVLGRESREVIDGLKQVNAKLCTYRILYHKENRLILKAIAHIEKMDARLYDRDDVERLTREVQP